MLDQSVRADIALEIVGGVLGLIWWGYKDLRGGIRKLWENNAVIAKETAASALSLAENVTKKEDFIEYRRRTEAIEKTYVDRAYYEKARIETKEEIREVVRLEIAPIKVAIESLAAQMRNGHSPK